MSEMWEEDDEDLENEQAQPAHRARRSGETGSNLYLLTGLVIGLVLGLVYAWGISPVKYTDETPATLSAAAKDQYRSMIALAYAADQDIARAAERLNLLDTGNPQLALASQAQRVLARKQSAEEARALTILAANLGKPSSGPGSAQSPAIPPDGAATSAATTAASLEPAATLNDVAAIQTPTVPAPTQTATSAPAPSFTPRPTATAMQVINAPFALKSKREVCDGSIPAGQMQVQVNDSTGKPLPGVKITVTWQNGQDSFFTGLTPEVNPGFADYQMAAQVMYHLRAGEVSQPVDGLAYNPGCSLVLELVQGR